MILIVGLGNPGKKYQLTRHNLGFRVVDEFAKKNNFPNFKISRKFNTEISDGFLNDEKIILAKPQTLMNLSGKAVKLLIANFSKKNQKLNNSAMAELISFSDRLWVIHDDIDLPLGKIRISRGRGAAGHKGVESIIKEIKTRDFVRFRIGIKPRNSHFYATAQKLESFVLQKFNKEEEKIVKEVIQKTVEAIEFSLKEGVEKAMSRYNL